MALWGGLGQAATVAQLVGADVGRLISMIMQAAGAAEQNKRECEQLARRVFMIAELLPYLQDPEMMRRLEIRRTLDGLGDTLREAHELVTSCRGRCAAYRLVMAGRQAERFREVQRQVDSYLLLVPLITHIDVTRRLDRIYNLLPNPSPHQSQLEAADQVAQQVVPLLPLGGGAEDLHQAPHDPTLPHAHRPRPPHCLDLEERVHAHLPVHGQPTSSLSGVWLGGSKENMRPIERVSTLLDPHEEGVHAHLQQLQPAKYCSATKKTARPQPKVGQRNKPKQGPEMMRRPEIRTKRVERVTTLRGDYDEYNYVMI